MVRWSEEELKARNPDAYERYRESLVPGPKGAGKKVEGRAVPVRQERIVVPDPEFDEFVRRCIPKALRGKPKDRSKYNAEKTTVDGITFDSKKEAARYVELKFMQAAGEIRYFLCQVPFHLPGGIRYFCDFAVCQFDGTMQYEDVKGMQTDVFKMKKKQVESLYPVTIILL